MTVEDHRQAIAANIPPGDVWAPKDIPGSNLFRWLTGLAHTFLRMQVAVDRHVDQVVPKDTFDYLEEWEVALSIPDDCFRETVNVPIRQFQVETKLAFLAGLSTKRDFEDLGLRFGITISVDSGIDHVSVADGGYELKLPALTIPGDFADVKEARHTLVVLETLPDAIKFPWDFPLLFSSQAQSSLRCVIEKAIPANTAVLFLEAP